MSRPSPEMLDRVRGLRVVRRFDQRPLAGEHIDAILEAGRWTGSSKNRQSWAFVTLETKRGREELARAGDFTAPLAGAAYAVALVRLPGGYDFDIGRVAQNMMLAADALGVGSCPVTLHREADARAILGVPADHGCRYAIAFGYPAQGVDDLSGAGSLVPKGRKPMAEVVHVESFRHG